MLSIIDKIEKEKEFNEYISDLEYKLKPVDFSVKLKLLTSKNAVTRKWLLNAVDEWVNGTKNSLWLVGNPGTGKSVFSGQLYFERSYIEAIYFCEYDKREEVSLTNIIKSICFQIALRNADYSEFIKAYDFSKKLSENILFEELLVKPLNLLIDGKRAKKIILFDAIDELPNEISSKLLQLIYARIEDFPKWIKFVITCRNNPSYERYYQSYNSCLLILGDERSRLDIISYVQSKLELFITNKIRLERLVLQIAEKSDGVFLYASEVVNDILKGHIIEDDELPSGLYSLFNMYFNRVVETEEVYHQFIAPIISLIIISKVSLSPEFISKVLHFELSEVLFYLRKIQDYFVLISENETTIVKPYHKSIVDWFSELKSYEKYYIDFSATKRIIVEYGIKCFKTGELFDDYYTESFYTYIVTSENWRRFTHHEIVQFYVHLIKSAVFNGNIPVEKKILNILKNVHFDSDEEKILYLSRRLNYETRNSSSNIIATTTEMIELIDKLKDVSDIINYATEISAAFFYAGENYKGIRFMEKIEENYSNLINSNKKLNTSVKHVYGLLAHDVDKNLKVIESAINASEGYLQEKLNYDYIISLVNLYDGYMGAGELTQAFSILEEVDNRIDKDTSLQIKDIHYLCKGNLYLTSGRIMTSLAFYEKGLKLANKIGHTWDIYYGKIWRELALVLYGDRDSITNLINIYNQLNGNEYKYLKSLVATFYFIALYRFKEKQSDVTVRIFNENRESSFPGHRALIHAVSRLLEYDLNYFTVQETIKDFMRCEGIKGGYIIAKIFYEHFGKENKEFGEWIHRFIIPIFDYQKFIKEEITIDLDTKFRVKSFNCKDCQAMCCYDGVYVSPKEAQRILDFIDANKTYFKDYLGDVIIDSNWEDLISGKKTATQEFFYTNSKFPKHFNKTRCVFARDDGFCQLQKVATALGLHPWKIKPSSCWMFPLDVDSEENIIPPPICKEEDPNFIDGKYDGYVTALECGQFDEAGTVWTDIYYNEIEYYDFLKKKIKDNKVF